MYRPSFKPFCVLLLAFLSSFGIIVSQQALYREGFIERRASACDGATAVLLANVCFRTTFSKCPPLYSAKFQKSHASFEPDACQSRGYRVSLPRASYHAWNRQFSRTHSPLQPKQSSKSIRSGFVTSFASFMLRKSGVSREI